MEWRTLYLQVPADLPHPVIVQAALDEMEEVARKWIAGAELLDEGWGIPGDHAPTTIA